MTKAETQAPSLLRDAAVGPTYRIDRPFEWNFAHGPDFVGPWPTVPQTPSKAFLGLPVRSRFGVPSSILMNARWVETYARLGFDILTYKTVRSVARDCHPFPNWAFVDAATARRVAAHDEPQIVTDVPEPSPATATMAGSFGMPSTAPAFWREDIVRARAALGTGQILVVSIVATVEATTTRTEACSQVERLAAEVREAGAQAIETNLSCPNVPGREGEIYMDVEMAAEIAAATRRGAGDAPLLVKLGELESARHARGLLRALDPHVQGVVAINAPSRQIEAPDGTPYFGEVRQRAGITNGAIHEVALNGARTAAGIIRADALDLALVAVGGAATPEHVARFMDAGADAVQSATAAMWNPHLAVEVKNADPEI